MVFIFLVVVVTNVMTTDLSSVSVTVSDEVKPPKAKSFDTMLCLDISDSMKQGGAFEEMKDTVLAFIDGETAGAFDVA